MDTAQADAELVRLERLERAHFPVRTRPTTIVWSPPSYSFHSTQSIHAHTPVSTGAPDGAARHFTPANLSTPDRQTPRSGARGPRQAR